MNAPMLFGRAARWSNRLRCWRWKMDPLTACAYQSPTGHWWISGAINSFHVASRPHADIARATRELEVHLVSLNKRLSRLIERSVRDA